MRGKPCSGKMLRRRRFGGSSAEYLLILALIVIPIALLTPVIYGMYKVYGGRIAVMIRMPFG